MCNLFLSQFSKGVAADSLTNKVEGPLSRELMHGLSVFILFAFVHVYDAKYLQNILHTTLP